MAQAKLTISASQAKRLGLLMPSQKYDPINAITFEAKSGVNLRFTPTGSTIDVMDNADIGALKLFYAKGYFSVAAGKIADETTCLGISILDTMLTVSFDQQVYIDGGLAGIDFEVLLDDVPVADLTVGEILLADAAKTFTVDIGETPSAEAVVSLEIKATGAAKIKDTGDVAISPVTKTTIA